MPRPVRRLSGVRDIPSHNDIQPDSPIRSEIRGCVAIGCDLWQVSGGVRFGYRPHPFPGVPDLMRQARLTGLGLVDGAPHTLGVPAAVRSRPVGRRRRAFWGCQQRIIQTKMESRCVSCPPHAAGITRVRHLEFPKGDTNMYEFLRPIMRAWYATEIAAGGSSPKPLDAPTVTATQPGADNVLLIGNGPLHGWGVLTHRLAITGHLANECRAETGRPCSVHYIGDEAMTIASTRAWIGDHNLAQYDAVVVVLGMNDAVRLTPLKKWEEDYRALLEYLTEKTNVGTPMVVAGLQPVRSVTPYNKALGNVAEFHAGRMNKVVEDITSDFSAITYFRLPEPVMDPGMPLGSTSVYRSWASDIATHLSLALDTVRALNPTPPKPLVETEYAWSGTKTLIDQAATGGSDELQRLAALAQDTFAVDLAGVSLIDGDRVWFAVNTHVLPKSAPAELVYCNAVVQQQAPLVVPDAQKDPRFKGNAFIDITGMDFYAGHPLTSTTGETIGTFCLYNSSPKADTAVSMEALQILAMQAETELRRYETTPATPDPVAPEHSLLGL